VAIGERDAHKIVHVLRMHDGDALEIIDGDGRAFDAVLRTAGGPIGADLVTLRAAETGTATRIDIAQGIPKGSKMDFVIEKATELGASAIFPVYSERAVVQDIGSSKLDRWRRLAQSATAQSDRRDVPNVAEPMRFEALLERFPEYDVILMPWEQADHTRLGETLPALIDGAMRILVIVGPEGGFSAAEAKQAANLGAHVIRLGQRILRSETAALAVLSILAFLLEM
jgi:16S rRNA (uracil1498-N3)-methyltransferase